MPACLAKADWRPFCAMLLVPSIWLTAAGVGEARPEPEQRAKAFCLEQGAQSPMPNLEDLLLRTDPQVQTEGRLIKGMYYSQDNGDINDLIGFWLSCNKTLEYRPFLAFDFRTNKYSLDKDRDGCAEEIGFLSHSKIDPAAFLHRIDDAEQYCYEDHARFNPTAYHTGSDASRHLNSLRSTVSPAP